MSYLKDISQIKEAIELAEQGVCSIYNIARADIHSRKRSQKSSQARFAVWYILRTKYNFSSPTIAREYGYDHTTVLHGIKMAQTLNMHTEMDSVDKLWKSCDKTVGSGGTTLKNKKVVHTLSTEGVDNIAPFKVDNEP